MTSYDIIATIENQAVLLDQDERFDRCLTAGTDPLLTATLHRLNESYFAHEGAIRYGYGKLQEAEAAKMAAAYTKLAEADVYPYFVPGDDEFVGQYVFTIPEEEEVAA